MTFQIIYRIKVLGIILLFLSGCTKSEDQKSSCLVRLLNQPFDNSHVSDLWPSNRIEVAWRQTVRKYYPKNELYTQSLIRVYMPDNDKKWTCERIGEFGVEYYNPSAEMLLRNCIENNYSSVVFLELYGENMALLKNICNSEYSAPVSLTEAKVLFPSQVWHLKKYINMKADVFLNNEIVADINIGGKMFVAKTKYLKDTPVSVVISSSIQNGDFSTEPFVQQSRNLFDLSDLHLPTGWNFPHSDLSLNDSLDRVDLCKKDANPPFTRMLSMGILPRRHECVQFLKSTLPPDQSGLYASPDNSIKINTSFRFKNREQIRFIYVDLEKIGHEEKIVLPEHISLPTSIQDCRNKFDCYYECTRQDSVLTFIACAKIGFMFRNGMLASMLYYGDIPSGDEFVIFKKIAEEDCRR